MAKKKAKPDFSKPKPKKQEEASVEFEAVPLTQENSSLSEDDDFSDSDSDDFEQDDTDYGTEDVAPENEKFFVIFCCCFVICLRN